MKFYHYLTCFIGLFVSIGDLVCQSEYEIHLKKEINKLIQYESPIDYDQTPGFIVALIDQDSTYYIPFGTHVSSSEEITKDDVFEVGSVTKGLVSEILRNAKIPIDEKLETYLDDEQLINALSDLRLIDLLNHKTSLTKRPKGFGLREQDLLNPYKDYTLEDLKSYLIKLTDPIKSKKCSYSHSNFAILELLEGIDLNHASDLFLDQTGMFSSNFKKIPNLSLGITAGQKQGTAWEFKSFKYSEGLKTTANDLGRFVRYMLSKSENDWQTYNEAKCETIYNDKYYNALGWAVIEDKAKYDIYALTGRTSMHACFVAFIKETNTGVVILSNSSVGTGGLGMEILRTLNNNWKRKP